MPTHCNLDSLDFGSVEGRAIVAGFDGGQITSDAGALLLGATDKAVRLIERFAATFTDARDPDLIEHSVPTLVGQRVFGLALGYQDINEHDHLRHDPVLAALMGKMAARRKDCAALAGKSTLNRLEHSPAEGPAHAPGRYHKIAHEGAAIDRLFVDMFLEAHATPPPVIVLDPDATDISLHGQQEGRFFHGFYDSYCYLPLLIFCGRHLLCARLREASVDAAGGVTEAAFLRSRMMHYYSGPPIQNCSGVDSRGMGAAPANWGSDAGLAAGHRRGVRRQSPVGADGVENHAVKLCSQSRDHAARDDADAAGVRRRRSGPAKTPKFPCGLIFHLMRRSIDSCLSFAVLICNSQVHQPSAACKWPSRLPVLSGRNRPRYARERNSLAGVEHQNQYKETGNERHHLFGRPRRRGDGGFKFTRSSLKEHRNE